MPRLSLPVLAATVLAVAAGCGSSSSSQSQKPQRAADGALVIRMQDIQFVPKQVTVRVGQKVRWVNDDNVQHDVIADSGARFHSRTFGKGGTFTFTPTKPGTIAYECDLHPGMTGTLTVTK